MKLWHKVRKKPHDASNPAPSITTSSALTKTGQPIQRPLPPPAPYTTHPHVTHYSPSLALSTYHTICRCALPTAHGNAFTRRHHGTAYHSIPFLSPSGTPLTWEQAQHAFLDALGVDARVSPGWFNEDEELMRRVYSEETVRAVRVYRRVREGVERFGRIRCAVEGDVYWWGKVNPRGLLLKNIRDGDIGGVVVTVNGPFYGGGEGKGTGVGGGASDGTKRMGIVFRTEREEAEVGEEEGTEGVPL
ncbi:hypothetical protein BU23DRAFT_565496 [Bimuria novae-zelandiae CBS 107.79]|uniref:Uncharacterized protein n=1 Tax=Bimuria novae-zelandiae CBS 107.79 TaxID=1447943 RepID=A0A6A5VM82_9PLEO|nr:hypothetical protein BU23DRAFT_565496 [Bimuria novae-zelandiae CBS 107.79]